MAKYDIIDMLSELIIHPRTRNNFYIKDTLDMNAFKSGYEKSTAPVCYNGDIYLNKDIERIKSGL